MKITISLVKNDKGHYALPESSAQLNFFCGKIVSESLGCRPKKIDLIVSNCYLRGAKKVEYRYDSREFYRLCWRNTPSRSGIGYPGLTYSGFAVVMADRFNLAREERITDTAYLKFVDKD